MKKITKYVADCGTEFMDHEKCIQHEALMADLREIVKPFSEDPLESRCYIQYPVAMCVAAHKAFIERVKHLHPKFKDILSRWMEYHPSHAQRLVNECCPVSVDRLYYAFTCIDVNGRRFSQPYFVSHPQEAALLVCERTMS